MIDLARRRLWARRGAALIPLLALLMATVGFQAVILGARAEQAHVQGVIAANWNPPYDLLVRPPSLVTGLSAGDRLVRPNYLDSVHGGLSIKDVLAVRAVPGVAVAAPVGVVAIDYLWGVDYAIDMATLPRQGGLGVYRLTTTLTTDGGLSHVAGQTIYALVQGRSPLARWQTTSAYRADPTITAGGQVFQCDSTGPVECYGTAGSIAPILAKDGGVPWQPMWAGSLHPYANQLTAAVVAVDPSAENQLVGTDRCVTTGRGLVAADTPTLSVTGGEDNPARIPVLFTAHPGFDQRAQVVIEAAKDPLGSLAAAAQTLPPGSAGTINGMARGEFERFFTYARIGARSSSLDMAWTGAGGLGFASGGIFNPAQNTAQDTLSPVGYRGTPSTLRAVPAGPSDGDAGGYHDFRATNQYFNAGIDESADVPYFHALQRIREVVGATGVHTAYHAFTVVGRLDSECVTRAHPLLGSGFDIYANPDTTTADGTRLGPNGSLTNYVTPMPVITTNLAGGAFFSDPARFEDGRGPAFLSVIRVKVSGTDVPGPASQTRLEEVAAAIHAHSGLSVDIIKGSSTRVMAITLPAGSFGRPAMTVHEDWLTENVAIGFYQSISRTSVTMSLVVGVVATLLTAQTSYAAVRRRRGEMVLLRAIGWPSWRLALLMELEVVLLGAVVGVIALVVAGVIYRSAHPEQGVMRAILLAAPVVVALTALAGLAPAAIAARTRPLRALRGPGRIRRHRRLLWGPLSLGVREAVTTWRWQTALAALVTAVSATFLGAVLAVEQGFRSTLDSSALAGQLAAEVGPFDVLLAILAVGLGTVTAVSVVLVTTRERLPHLASLRALGWSRRQLAKIIAAQALTAGLVGGGLGVVALWELSTRIPGGLTVSRTTELIPLAVGLGCGAIAAAVALSAVHRRVAVAMMPAE